VRVEIPKYIPGP
jgi:hypothetical protein